MTESEVYDAGIAVRRAVLSDDYVDSTVKRRTPFNTEFQEFITRYAWGSIWTRPGLDHQTRRLLVLAMTIAGGRWDEFRLHLKAALEHGVPEAVIMETLMQSAVYCGVPAANTAFNQAAEVLEEVNKPT